MGPNPQFPADLVAFTKEILNGILHLLCGVNKITNISTTIKFRRLIATKSSNSHVKARS